jgi:hypothetical protein
MLSKYSLSCVQETKFTDRTYLSTFQLHLASSFTHKIFVDDPNSFLDRPTRGRRNGVFTVLRSDFPGFESVVELHELVATGRYLVVKGMVDSALLYIHNVNAPVDCSKKTVLL